MRSLVSCCEGNEVYTFFKGFHTAWAGSGLGVHFRRNMRSTLKELIRLKEIFNIIFGSRPSGIYGRLCSFVGLDP